MKPYKFLVVGSGLFGAVFAHEMSKRKQSCLVIDKRPHIGGNVYCENLEGINVHCYGAHIFHTNDLPIWNYVNSFVEFNRYTNSPIAVYRGKLFNLPFNMNTFHQLWGISTPAEARKIIAEQTAFYKRSDIKNLEQQAKAIVGEDIYNMLIKEYTEKQWGRPADQLPAFIIKRIPLRFTYDNNYFEDKYQGIPVGGYNNLIKGLLKNCEVRVNTDFFKNRAALEGIAETVVYTGKLDEFYNYRYGHLEYRSLRFEHKHLTVDNYQGNAVINFIDKDIAYTRIIEHKHFEFGNQETTVITREYPQAYTLNNEPYYPINDIENNRRYEEYRRLSLLEKSTVFGGRLAEFKYYDMHQIIASALKKVQLFTANLRGADYSSNKVIKNEF